MHHDHAQEGFGRDLEHRRHADFRLGLQLAALHARDGGVQAQRVLHDVDLAVVGHLAQRLGVAQILVFRSTVN